MTDLKTLALQSDPIQGEITEILSPELRAHVQKLIDAAVMKERAERDRLREVLEMLQKAMTEGHQEAYNNAIAACFEALEEAR